MAGEMMQHALQWAARGFRVFPLLPGTKDPRPGHSWLDTATNDLAEVEALWSMADWNIGVATDGLIVVDIDVKNGKDGTASYLELDLPWDTLIVRTPTGGRHAYFSGPDRQNSAGRLGSGLDVRGFHGYVVGPGSHIPETGWYEVEVDLPVAVAPDRLVDLLDLPHSRSDERVALVDLDSTSALVRAVDFLETGAPLAVEGQGGDATTFRVAATLKDYGVSADVAHELLLEYWNPSCFPPWDADQLRTKVDNAYAYGHTAPGAFSPEAEFAGVYIPEIEHAPVVETEDEWFNHGDPWDKETAWLFYKTLPQIGVAVLTAQPQAGKTFVALEMARCLATGKPFFEESPDIAGGTALLFAGTEGSGLAERMAALEEEDRLPIAAMAVHSLRSGDNLAKLQAKLEAKSTQMLKDHGVPIRLVVLETLSASGLLEDENSNAEAAEAFAALASLSRHLKALVLVTHHPPKNGTGERGAGAIRGSADYVLEIDRAGTSPVRDLHLLKGRNAPQRTLGSFSLVPVTLGLDSRGREVTSLTVSTGAPQTKLQRASANSDLFLEIIADCVHGEGGLIEGQEMVVVDVAKRAFLDRWPSKSRDPSNLNKKWRELMAWAESAAAIEQVLFAGTKYVRVRGGP